MAVGERLTVRQRVARWLLKSAELPFTVDRPYLGGGGAVWGDGSFDRLSREGYRQNAAVFACVSALVFGCDQPRPQVLVGEGEPEPRHPLQRRLNRPNPLMSWQELSIFNTTYKSVGGYTCLHKVRVGREVRELWPYHAGQMWPVARGANWIDRFEFRLPDGTTKDIDPADVIMLKWPSVDLQQPWLPLPPLRALAREVDTDSEATRYLYALLHNDATPRTVLNVKTPLTDLQFERLRQQFSMKHGGENRGGVGVVEGDASITRMSMNLQELAFDALRAVPEARIAAAFKVPAMYAGLNVGLSHSTYANNTEARRAFIEDTVMQLLALDAGELTADLGAEFGGDVVVEFDYSKVVGLQENEDAKFGRALNAWDKGILTRNEARVYLGLPRVEDLRLAPGAPALPAGDTFKTSPQPMALSALPAPDVIDVTPAKQRLRALKMLKAASTDTLEQQLERASQRLLDGMFARLADAVEE